MRSGNTRAAYTTLKALTRTNQTKTAGIEDGNGKLLTKADDVSKRWTEYCKGLYNIELNTNPGILNTNRRIERETTPPILKEEVQHAIKYLKPNKSPGIDNVPSELIRHGGEATSDALTVLCQKVVEQKKWPKSWTQSLVIPLPKKGNLKECKNYRTISLISHPSKVLLRIILNRIQKRTEELLAEEQAGFRRGKSTVQQVFNCRMITEKCLQHQREVYHNFIDFKKAFDRVWHDGLWDIMREYNFEEDLVQTIEALYKSASSAVLINNEAGEFFETTVGVRQGCILSPTLFNLYLEKIMQEALHKYEPTLSIGGRQICNLRFADDIDLMASNETDLQTLTKRLDNAASQFGMEINTEKSQILVNGDASKRTQISVGGQVLQEVEAFKYLGVTLTKDGSSTKEVKTRLGMATAALTRLTKIWKSTIDFKVKLKLYKSLVVSILLYGCEAWTLTADLEKRICAFESKCFRKLLRVSYMEHRTNSDVLEEVEARAGAQEPLLSTIRRRKLSWFGHFSRHNGLCRTTMEGTVEGKRRRGRQRLQWMDNIKKWTGMTVNELKKKAQDRCEWRGVVKSASQKSPRRSADHGSE